FRRYVTHGTNRYLYTGEVHSIYCSVTIQPQHFMTEIRHPSTNPFINYLRDTVGRYFQRLLQITCAVSETIFTLLCRLLGFPSPIVSCLVPSIMQFVGRIFNGPAGFLHHLVLAVV